MRQRSACPSRCASVKRPAERQKREKKGNIVPFPCLSTGKAKKRKEREGKGEKYRAKGTGDE